MKDKADYIRYKLQKSTQSLREARLLMENGKNDTALAGYIMRLFTQLTHCLPKTDLILKHIAVPKQFSPKNLY